MLRHLVIALALLFSSPALYAKSAITKKGAFDAIERMALANHTNKAQWWQELEARLNKAHKEYEGNKWNFDKSHEVQYKLVDAKVMQAMKPPLHPHRFAATNAATIKGELWQLSLVNATVGNFVVFVDAKTADVVKIVGVGEK